MYPTLNDYVNRGPIHPEAFYSLNIDINFEKKRNFQVFVIQGKQWVVQCLCTVEKIFHFDSIS